MVSGIIESPVNGSNEQRIRRLEDELAAMRLILESFRASASQRNPIAKLVQVPSGGVPGRAQDSNKAESAECDVVWLNSEGVLYVTAERPVEAWNWSRTDIPGTGSRLALIVKHDSGRWVFHGFCCNDDGTVIVTDSPTEKPVQVQP